jgi:SAM-dependent methyltransferase
MHLVNNYRRLRGLGIVAIIVAGIGATTAALAEQREPGVPALKPGLIGRDADWVPTPPALIEKMLDMARLTPDDYVIDLGSGDGRNVIAAAKRGARGHGVEFNPDLVALSRSLAEKEGVADRAQFVQGDMYEADISKADVLPLFLLDENLAVLLPRLLALRPGTRIVNNFFEIPDWDYDEVGKSAGECGVWCVAYLYIVPARVAGTWRLSDGSMLTLRQEFQWITGVLSSDGESEPVLGRLTGSAIRFTAGVVRYEGRVDGDSLAGEIKAATPRDFAAQRVAQ